LWEIVQPMLDLPPCSDRDGHAVYMNAKRTIEKRLDQNPASFREFLFQYEITRKKLLEVLDAPCPGWFRRKKE